MLTAMTLCACTVRSSGLERVDGTPSAKLESATQSLQFTLPLYPGGEPFTLSSRRGNVVLLDVWATWCEPCRDELPLYQNLADEFGPRGLEVYTINVDADSRAILPFLEEAQVRLRVLLDPEARVVESKFKLKLMPSAFLIDKKGVIRHVHEGFDEAQLATWLVEIEALLAEPYP